MCRPGSKPSSDKMPAASADCTPNNGHTMHIYPWICSYPWTCPWLASFRAPTLRLQHLVGVILIGIPATHCVLTMHELLGTAVS